MCSRAHILFGGCLQGCKSPSALPLTPALLWWVPAALGNESESQGEVASHLPSPGPLPLDEQLCGVKKMTGTRLKQYYTYSQSLINAAPSLTAGVPGRMQ